MVVKTLYYIMAIFLGIMLFLFYQEPYFLDMGTSNNSDANIEMSYVVDYDIDIQGVNRIIKATKVNRYDQKDILFDGKMLLKKDGFIYILESGIVELINKIATFKDDVTLTRSDGAIFKMKRAIYNLQNQTLSTDTYFTLTEKNFFVKGNSFFYNIDSKKITANNVYMKYKMEDE